MPTSFRKQSIYNQYKSSSPINTRKVQKNAKKWKPWEDLKLITTSTSADLSYWSVESQTLLKHYEKLHDSRIYCLAISKDQKFMFTAGWDMELKQWILNQPIIGKLFKNSKKKRCRWSRQNRTNTIVQKLGEDSL